MLTEGIATISGTALAKDAPHPNTARLFFRWARSEEGQKVLCGRRAHAVAPSGEPREKIRPATIYPIGTEEIKEWPSTKRGGKNFQAALSAGSA